MRYFTEMRQCKCGNYMVDGFIDEDLCDYYCTEKCLNKHFTKSEQKEYFEDGSLFWTDWYDDTDVFLIFDNQYISLEDAEFVQRNFGNPSNQIKEAAYTTHQSVFTIRDGQQIELEEL